MKKWRLIELLFLILFFIIFSAIFQFIFGAPGWAAKVGAGIIIMILITKGDES